MRASLTSTDDRIRARAKVRASLTRRWNRRARVSLGLTADERGRDKSENSSSLSSSPRPLERAGGSPEDYG